MNKIKNLIRDELIGEFVEIIDSVNKSYIGIFGRIIDETKNTFKIETEDGEKTVIKQFCKFLFFINGYKVLIDGKLLKKRPWDRIKLKIIKW